MDGRKRLTTSNTTGANRWFHWSNFIMHSSDQSPCAACRIWLLGQLTVYSSLDLTRAFLPCALLLTPQNFCYVIPLSLTGSCPVLVSDVHLLDGSFPICFEFPDDPPFCNWPNLQCFPKAYLANCKMNRTVPLLRGRTAWASPATVFGQRYADQRGWTECRATSLAEAQEPPDTPSQS